MTSIPPSGQPSAPGQPNVGEPKVRLATTRPTTTPPGAPPARNSQAARPAPARTPGLKGRLARLPGVLGKESGNRAHQAARVAVSLAVLVACLVIGAQIALRWESTGFSAVGALNLSSGQILYGNIGINWSGDFVVGSTTDDEQPPVAVSVASLRILTITQPSTATTPWRLMVGLLLALAAACVAGWSVFKSQRWEAA